jgi:hypothetical protein
MENLPASQIGKQRRDEVVCALGDSPGENQPIVLGEKLLKHGSSSGNIVIDHPHILRRVADKPQGGSERVRIGLADLMGSWRSVHGNEFVTGGDYCDAGQF